MYEYNQKCKSVKRIYAKGGEKTYMFRVFYETREEAEAALVNGIYYLGRRFRCESPRENNRHYPCRNCCLYGHKQDACTNKKVCHRCGKHPIDCQHPKNATDIRYCVTCKQDSHFTGQMCCPSYPRDIPPPPLDKPHIPLITPPRKPVQSNKIEWPAINPQEGNPWLNNKNHTTETNLASNEITNTDANFSSDKEDIQSSATGTKQQKENSSNETTNLDEKLSSFKQSIEEFVEVVLSDLEDRVLICLGAIIHNLSMTSSPDPNILINSLAKKIFEKRVIITTVKNHIDVFVHSFQKEMSTHFDLTLKGT